MLLYTAIPNNTNSKSVAGEHEGDVSSRTATNRFVNTHQEPIETIDVGHSLKMAIYYSIIVVEDPPERQSDEV